MNKIKSSKDYIKLRSLLNSGYVPSTIKIKIEKNTEKSKITLKAEGKNTINFESDEGDVAMICFSLKSLYNQFGNLLVGEIKDLNKFYSEVEMLMDFDNKKFQQARTEILEGKIKLGYFPHLLFRQFLEENELNKCKPYLKLKQDYYLIKVLHIEEMKLMLVGMENIKKQQSLKTTIFELTLDLFKDAFHKDKNFLKNYHLFQKFNKADVMDILVSASENLKINDNLFDMLSKRNGVSAKEGLTHVISCYATMAESINKLLNIIRGAIELIKGNSNPCETEGTFKNWSIIKNNPVYSKIVEDFDPRIRHGKAHNNFEIDDVNRKVNFYEEGRIRKLEVSYSFEDIRRMWHRVHIILSALVIAVGIEQSALTGVVLDSFEYKLSLLRLDNFKPLNL